jgi:hypothetical protein
MRDARHTTGLLKRQGDWPVKRLAEAAPRLHPSADPEVAAILNPDAKTGGDSVYARADHGRWIVDCPDCRGAQLTHHEDPRFLCVDCANVGNQGRYRPVTWPKEHAKIGALLDARVDVSLRNWAPPETVADLRRENDILDGLPTPAHVEQPPRDLIRDPAGTAQAWRDYKAAEARYATWTIEQHSDPTPAMLADVALINGYQAAAARTIMERDGEL